MVEMNRFGGGGNGGVAGVRDRQRGAITNNNARKRWGKRLKHTRGVGHVRGGTGVKVPFAGRRLSGLLLLNTQIVQCLNKGRLVPGCCTVGSSTIGSSRRLWLVLDGRRLVLLRWSLVLSDVAGEG
jgi:hypothetical protein